MPPVSAQAQQPLFVVAYANAAFGYIPPLAGASVGGPKVPRDRIHWRPDRSVGHGAEVRYENFYIANIVDKDAVQILRQPVSQIGGTTGGKQATGTESPAMLLNMR